ncbi:putative acyltransferase-like protein [Lasiodiplodia theobromae]|nr:putative acyltransferase-like protein [Lasiodiplodia theobromae]
MDWQKLKALGPPGPSFPRALWSKQPSDISPNAWIDGVRGLAALIVTLDHLFWHLIGPLFQGWKSFPADAHSSILQLPGPSIIFGARAMVPLFFVISGYCISLSSIRARSSSTTNPQSSSPSPLLTTLSTSVFRRALRLMLPVLAIAAFSQLVYACGGYSAWPEHFDAASLPAPSSSSDNPSSPLAHARYLLAYAGSLFDQVLTGTRCPGTGTADCPVGLNGQLWTIPLELRGSFVVYLCVLGLARTRDKPRKCVLAALAGAMVGRGWWEGATFVAGLLIAEVTSSSSTKGDDSGDGGDGGDGGGGGVEMPPAWLPLPLRSSSRPSSYDRWSTTIRGAAEKSGKRLCMLGRHRKNARSAACALVGIWLLCFPNDPDMLGGYGPCYTFLMSHLTPTRWFVVSEGGSGGAARAEFCWRAVGGVAFVAALAGSGSTVSAVLRRPFCSSAAQYFGRISFMLYLVHIMVIQCMLYRVQGPLVEVLGEERGWAAGVVARLVLLPPMFWIAEVLVEWLDRRSIGLAKWLSKAWAVEER